MSVPPAKNTTIPLAKYLFALSLENSLVKMRSKGVQDIGHHAYGTENLGDINTVHDRSQHSDLVCLGTVNVLTGTSSPEIATTDNDPT